MSTRNPMIPIHIHPYGDKEDKQEGVRARARGIVSNVNHWDRDGLTIPRQFRARFGPGVRLTFHMEPGRTQGRQPYWWGCHE